LTSIIDGADIVADSRYLRHFVAVSDVPAADLTKRSTLMNPGNVLGKTEAKFPVLGAAQVPHALSCNEQDCRDVLLPKKGK
jgi:hypothetical protein